MAGSQRSVESVALEKGGGGEDVEERGEAVKEVGDAVEGAFGDPEDVAGVEGDVGGTGFEEVFEVDGADLAGGGFDDAEGGVAAGFFGEAAGVGEEAGEGVSCSSGCAPDAGPGQDGDVAVVGGRDVDDVVALEAEVGESVAAVGEGCDVDVDGGSGRRGR